MQIRDNFGYLRGLHSNRARLSFVANQIAARLGVGHEARSWLRNGISGRFQSGGNTFELRPGSIDAWIVHPGHERETHRWIRRRFADRRGVMVDVGAYCCAFSLLHRDQFEHVYAFEPFPDNFAACARNLALSDAQDQVTLVNAAVTSSVGQARLFLDQSDTHSLVGSGVQSIGVAAETLDHALAQVQPDRIRLIKIDIEGAEIDALRGAGTILQEGSAALIIEANSPDHQSALRDHLAAYDYHCDGVFDLRNMVFQKAGL